MSNRAPFRCPSTPSMGRPAGIRGLLLPTVLLGLGGWAAACAGLPEGPALPPHPAVPPAILVSIDALNEAILRRTLTPDHTPTFHRLFDEGACAEYAVSGFPSLTAPSHAVLWTGAWGNVSGVTGNLQHRLPRERHTVLETIRGFSWEALSAEPLWITAGKAGMRVAGHHVTQAPYTPGYLPVAGERTPAQEARRREAADILARPDVNVLNGYNTMAESQRVLTAASVQWTDPGDWVNLDGLGSPVPPRTFRFDVAGTPVYGVLHGTITPDPTGSPDLYSAITVALRPDAAGGVTAHAAPVESEPLDARPLARHFAGPLEIRIEGEEGGEWEEAPLFLYLRLFEVAPDGSDFLLFQPNMPVVDGNRPDLMERYGQAAGGWPGNSGLPSYERGALGPTLLFGGDGTAEARYLETAEFLTRQFMRGSEWVWRTFEPRLMMDYFPESDAIDHAVLGFLEPSWPGYDPARAESMRRLRARVWELVDARLAHLEGLVRERGGVLFVSGDHGMRPSWNQFLPNVALRRAGLLAMDADGIIDLQNTRAVSPNGNWVSVNRTAWQGGIVPPDEEHAVISAVREALEGVRGPDGEVVVTRTFVPGEASGMGIGGPTGGDVYWATAPGYSSGAGHRGEVAAGPDRLRTGHGFPPGDPDMYTVFCALGEGFGPRRIPGVQTTAVAPTVADFLGLPPPADAGGVSVLDQLRPVPGR